MLAAFAGFPESSKMLPSSSHRPRIPLSMALGTPQIALPPQARGDGGEKVTKAANRNAPRWICW